MVKKLLPFLALGCLLFCVLGACGTGGTPAHTASGTEVHMNRTPRHMMLEKGGQSKLSKKAVAKYGGRQTWNIDSQKSMSSMVKKAVT